MPFEGPGVMDQWLRVPGNHVTTTRFYEDHKLPFVDICDLLIIMGGPMSVHDGKELPWLKKEKEFIEKAISKNKKVLGICLGAQLIADVLGAKVYKNKEKEIGWFPVRFNKTNTTTSQNFKVMPENATVFHWHGETFDLPKGALHIAESDACKNQAFEFNGHVIGLQFHLELLPESVDALIQNCGNELVDSKYIQKEEQIRSDEYRENNFNLLQTVLENLRK